MTGMVRTDKLTTSSYAVSDRVQKKLVGTGNNEQHQVKNKVSKQEAAVLLGNDFSGDKRNLNSFVIEASCDLSKIVE